MLTEDAVAELLNQLRDSLRLVGTVSGTSGTKVLVTVRGSLLTLPRLAFYTPTVGDVVQIQGPAPWVVLGKIA